MRRLQSISRSRLMYGPLPPEVLVYQALVQVQLGDREEAKKIARTMQRSAGPQSLFQAAIAEIYALCGDKALAAGIVEESGLLDPAHPAANFARHPFRSHWEMKTTQSPC